MSQSIGYDTIYTKQLGDKSYNSEGFSVIETPDKNLLLSTGYNLGTTVYCDWRPKLYMTNAAGDSTWSRIFVAGGGKMKMTRDGNFINTNAIHNLSNCGLDTIRITKFKMNGDTIWTRKFFFGVVYNQPTDVIQTADDGFAATGFYGIQPGGGGFLSYVIKLDASGNTQWIKHFGQLQDQIESNTIKQDSKGNYAIYGFTPGAGNVYRLIKIDGYGNTLWSSNVFNLTNPAGYGAMVTLPDDGYIFIGGTVSATTSNFISRVNKDGQIQFFKNISMPSDEFVTSIVKYIPEHNAYLFANKKLYLTDTAGNILWTGPNFGDIFFRDIIQTANKDIVAIGYKRNLYPSKESIFYVRLRDTTAVILPPAPILPKDTIVAIYPNPVRDHIRINLDSTYGVVNVQLFNMLGQIVFNNVYTHTNYIDIWMNRYPAATYILRLFYDNKQLVKKIIKY